MDYAGVWIVRRFALIFVSCDHSLHDILQQSGFEKYIKILTQLKETLCAIYDVDKNNHTMYEKEAPLVNCYDDLDAMLDDFDAAIVIAQMPVPTIIISKLLDAKKHVFLEWPLMLDSTDFTSSLLQLAQKRKVVFDCSQMWLPDTTIEMLCQIISKKTYGRLRTLEFSTDACDDFKNSFNDQKYVDSLIFTSCMNCIYTVNLIFGAMPNIVFARRHCRRHRINDANKIESEFYLHAMLGYDDSTAMISYDNNNKTSQFGLCIKATLEDATILVNGITRCVTVYANNNNKSTSDEYNISKSHGKVLNYDHHLFCSVQNFIDAICNVHEKKKHLLMPSKRIKDAIATAKITKAALLSSDNGIPIYLDLR